MKITGVIPARYKSSRFEGKPLVDIHGKPMVFWVYHQARKVRELDDVVVATDDDRIAECCNRFDIPYTMTSTTHETGTDRVAEVAGRIDSDVFINIQGDEPAIKPEMIGQLAGAFKDPAVYFATLKKHITDAALIQSVNTVKVVTDSDQYALYFSRSIIPSNVKSGVATPVYRHVGIYGYTKEFLLQFSSWPQGRLELGEGIEPLRAMEKGYKIHVLETEYDSYGVDVPEHVAVVEKQMRKEGIFHETC